MPRLREEEPQSPPDSSRRESTACPFHPSVHFISATLLFDDFGQLLEHNLKRSVGHDAEQSMAAELGSSRSWRCDAAEEASSRFFVRKDLRMLLH